MLEHIPYAKWQLTLYRYGYVVRTTLFCDTSESNLRVVAVKTITPNDMPLTQYGPTLFTRVISLS